MSAPIPTAPVTSFEGVVAGSVLRGLTLVCNAALTFLVDGSVEEIGDGSATMALRLLAGVARPASGRVRALGVDPASDAAVRRHIALLGDDVLVEPTVPLEEAARSVALARDVPFDVVAPAIASGRRAVADAIAAVDRARLVLVRHPERYADAGARDRITTLVGMAMERGAQVVLATSKLDDWLHLAPHADSLAALIVHGRVATAARAHELPWASPTDGVSTRVVRVSLDSPSEDLRASAPPRTTPAARLGADLLADAAVGPLLGGVEQVGPLDLRLHTRDPRALARALAARAHAGVAIRSIIVAGATTGALATAYGGRPW